MHNKTEIIGNVGRDPEMHFTPSGQTVTSFSVATNRQYTNGAGETVKESIWFKVTAWGKLAEICNQYVKKGMLVYVDGSLTPDKSTGAPRVYEKKDGTWAASFEINAQTVRFLSHKENGEQAQQPANDDPFA